MHSDIRITVNAMICRAHVVINLLVANHQLSTLSPRIKRTQTKWGDAPFATSEILDKTARFPRVGNRAVQNVAQASLPARADRNVCPTDNQC